MLSARFIDLGIFLVITYLIIESTNNTRMLLFNLLLPLKQIIIFPVEDAFNISPKLKVTDIEDNFKG